MTDNNSEDETAQNQIPDWLLKQLKDLRELKEDPQTVATQPKPVKLATINPALLVYIPFS